MEFRVWIDDQYYPEEWEAESIIDLLIMLRDAIRFEDMPVPQKLRIELLPGERDAPGTS